jgi:HAD superfamily hydrolase (TIGR01450 family)
MPSARLLASAEPLAARYDVALLDLDGVVYVGGDEVPGASAALAAARGQGLRLAFVTNNASRPPAVVAEHLTRLGIPADAAEVITSAQAAAHYLAERLPSGSRVLVLGTTGLTEALTERGLVPVATADEDPRAVVQGYSPDADWRMLAEGAVAIRRGLPWVATNLDATVPSPRGPLPGNGSLVAALRHATGATPVSTGKPDPTMHRETVERSGAQRPIVVGDRLDTDIGGANAAGCASLAVLTGVTSPAELLAAPEQYRPTYLAHDLGGLLVAHPAPRVTEGTVDCEGWAVRAREGRLHLSRERADDPRDRTACDGTAGDSAVGDSAASNGGPAEPGDSSMDALRCLCVAAWISSATECAAEDGPARAALAELGLV